MAEKTALQRSQALVLYCLTALEACAKQSKTQSVSIEDVSQWGEIFGAKESMMSVLTKLVAMQKNMQELQQRALEHEHAQEELPMTDSDWELLELCLQRRKERLASQAGDSNHAANAE